MTHAQSHTVLAWREMAEAPLTGEEILAQWRGEESTVHGVILWDDKECRWYEGDNFVSPPDAWMPIPLPPGTEPPQSINSELLVAAKEAKEALETCYNVNEYPANGKTSQDRAIALLDTAISNAEKAI